MKDSRGKRCFFCYSTADCGINLFDTFICAECEKKIVSSSSTGDDYDNYVEKIRQILDKALSYPLASI
ncbi:MAG: sigma factor G inhibitor Gin [Dethiobacteria bacterium]